MRIFEYLFMQRAFVVGILLAAAIMSAITYLIPWMIQQF